MSEKILEKMIWRLYICLSNLIFLPLIFPHLMKICMLFVPRFSRTQSASMLLYGVDAAANINNNNKLKLWCESTTNPAPCCASRHRAVSPTWPQIESGGHSTPSCKSVQPFSRNLANKEGKKQRYKQRNRSKTIPRPTIYRGRGNNETGGESLGMDAPP